MRNRLFGTVIAVVAGLSLAACSSSTDASTSGHTASSSATSSGDQLSVEASFYPLKYLTQHVGGDKVIVDSLTPDGAEPHDLELSPQKVAELGKADVAVYLAGFQGAVDDAIATNPPKTVIDVAPVVHLMPATGEDEDDHDAAESGSDHSGSEADSEEHDHGMWDPHFWLDPARMKAAALTIADKLAQASPDNAEYFKANAASLGQELDALSTQLVDGTKTCTHRTFVTAHAAFGYLASVAGLQQMGISGLDPDSAPSPARLQEISQVVKGQGLSTIFTEALIDPKVADTLANDLGVTTEVLDPIESQTDPSKDYQAVIRDNITKLQKALECHS